MKTYQDLIALNGNESERRKFLLDAINEHEASEEYSTAADADLYYKGLNPTIMNHDNFLYTATGGKVKDVWTANNKIASKLYSFFVTQAVQYLLGNGVTFRNGATKEKLGKDFDKKVQDALKDAINGSVSFGLYNNGSIDVFPLTEFVPFYDEENGALRAGVRFWQIDTGKPLCVTLYEEDGYTEYVKKSDDDGLRPKNEEGKRPYVEIVKRSKIDGERIVGGRNYPAFPIVPLWNVNKQSDLAGNRGMIDAYDLMTSGLVNKVDKGDVLYWVLKNCGGMDLDDDMKFIEQLQLTHVVHADDEDGGGADVDVHQANTPYEASKITIDMLREMLYKNFMALDVSSISANATNDQIQAAYEPLNQKTDDIEYEVTTFINGILAVAGIDDEPTYTRSQMSNRKETLDMVLESAQYLPEEYVTRKIMTLLGDADQIEAVMAQKIADEGARFDGGTNTRKNKENAAGVENEPEEGEEQA